MPNNKDKKIEVAKNMLYAYDTAAGLWDKSSKRVTIIFDDEEYEVLKIDLEDIEYIFKGMKVIELMKVIIN